MTRISQFAPPVVALALLAFVGAFGHLEIATGGVAEFRERSKAALAAMPLRLGDWEGTSRPIEQRALRLLSPNAHFNIYYQNRKTGAQAYYTVIQVEDARQMTGHAPPNCYPGSGWEYIKAPHEKTWQVGDQAVRGIEYEFRRNNSEICVRNFFIFPDGRFACTLAELDRFAEDYRKLKYGVAQVQVVCSARVPEPQRDEIFKTLVGSERSLEMVRVLRTGIPR